MRSDTRESVQLLNVDRGTGLCALFRSERPIDDLGIRCELAGDGDGCAVDVRREDPDKVFDDPCLQCEVSLHGERRYEGAGGDREPERSERLGWIRAGRRISQS